MTTALEKFRKSLDAGKTEAELLAAMYSHGSTEEQKELARQALLELHGGDPEGPVVVEVGSSAGQAFDSAVADFLKLAEEAEKGGDKSRADRLRLAMQEAQAEQGADLELSAKIASAFNPGAEAGK